MIDIKLNIGGQPPKPTEAEIVPIAKKAIDQQKQSVSPEFLEAPQIKIDLSKAKTEAADIFAHQAELIKDFPQLPITNPLSIVDFNPDDYSPKKETLQEMIFSGDQQAVTDDIFKGHSIVVAGTAGSGKTTIAMWALKQIMAKLPRFWSEDKSFYDKHAISTEHPVLKEGAAGIVFMAFTNRAVGNMKAMLPAVRIWQETSSGHVFNETCLTVHKFLQFKPVPDAGGKKQFQPTRGFFHQYCPNLKILVIDEAGMLESDFLFRHVLESMLDIKDIQLILMGDPAQLQSIGGSSVLNAALLNLPMHVLEHTYRFGGLLLDFSTQIRTRTLKVPKEIGKGGQWILQDGKAVILNKFFSVIEDTDETKAVHAVVSRILQLVKARKFDLAYDLLIIPRHVGIMGGQNLVRSLNNQLDLLYERATYLLAFGKGTEVVAIGDTILLPREPHLLVGIQPNRKYQGEVPIDPYAFGVRDPDLWAELASAYENQELWSLDEGIDRHMAYAGQSIDTDLDSVIADEDLVINTRDRSTNFSLLMLDTSTLQGELEDRYEAVDAHEIAMLFLENMRTHAMSMDYLRTRRKVTDKKFFKELTNSLLELGDRYLLRDWVLKNLIVAENSSDFSDFQSTYMTAYQVQGAESRKVITVFHKKMHGNLTANEPLYTAMTRSKQVLVNYISRELLDPKGKNMGIALQRIPGDTIEEKTASLLKKEAQQTITQERAWVNTALRTLGSIKRFGTKDKPWWLGRSDG